jgi:hypothetical protein
MQNSGKAEAQFRQSASAGPLFLPVRWSAIISVVRWTVDKIAVCPPLHIRKKSNRNNNAHLSA